MSSGLAYNGQDEVAPAPATPEFDIEKNKDGNAVTSSADSDSHDGVHFAADDRVKRTGVLWRITNKLSKYGVEERGIERIMPEERTQKSAWGCFWMWLAANCTISTFSLGTLGTSIWYMGFRDSALTILFFNLVFTIPVAFFSTFGPKTGMRQLTLARFSFGYWTVMIPVILNGIACIGWSTVNSIVGGQALRSVALHSDMKKIPVEVAIIIIAVCTVGFSFAGYKFVHTYEKYAWIPVVIVFIIYAAEIGPHVSATWGASGEAEASSVLSFGAAIVGFAIGWSSLAADYSCNLPEDTSSMKVFLLTYAGLNIPMITIEILGAAAMATFQNKTTWADAYSEEGVGGLLAAPLVGPIGGGGRFFTLILALSIVANNIPNLYSFALTAQVLGPWVQRIPRPFLTLFATVIYVILACVGAHNFETALDTLLLVLAYWLAIFITIVCEEHFIFRKGSFRNWNLDDVNNARKLPFGAAAFAALCCGWALAITFSSYWCPSLLANLMDTIAILSCYYLNRILQSQTWFVGPGAALIGNPQYGTDLGFELAAAATAVTFPLFRWYEKKKWGY